jgi:hypothetical protein
MLRFSISALFLNIYLLICPQLIFAAEKEVVGWVEKVRLFPSNLLVQGKLDSGADFSSLSATDIVEFDKDGVNWVKFSVQNRYGEKREITERVQRTALIKRHGKKSPQRRPVIRLAICLGNHYMETDVNLVDRSNFDFQMLIGRNFLAGNVLLDPASTYLTEPRCQGVPKK